MYKVYAKVLLIEGYLVACVGEYDDILDAEYIRDVEEVSWSDEGAEYTVTEEEWDTNCTYDQLQERIMK